MCLALLITGIDGTIVNVALPTLVRQLGATASQLQWIVDAYTIVFASFLLIAGNTGDRLGRKPCFIGGLLIFGVGSLACSQVHSPDPLILLRGVQGFGAAFIMPATLSILTNVFTDPAERARAIALWAGVSGLGVAIGPLVGGYLLEHYWWGSIFLVNVQVVVLAVVAAFAIVPNSKVPAAPALDLVGTVRSTSGLIALLFAIIQGPANGWADHVDRRSGATPGHPGPPQPGRGHPRAARRRRHVEHHLQRGRRPVRRRDHHVGPVLDLPGGRGHRRVGRGLCGAPDPGHRRPAPRPAGLPARYGRGDLDAHRPPGDRHAGDRVSRTRNSRPRSANA